MPVTGETPHHIPGNPDVGFLGGFHMEPTTTLAVPGNLPVNFMPDGTVADMPRYRIEGNPSPEQVMSGS